MTLRSTWISEVKRACEIEAIVWTPPHDTLHDIVPALVIFQNLIGFHALACTFFVHFGKSSFSSLFSLHACAKPRKAWCGTSEIHVCTSTVPSSLYFNKAWTSSSRLPNFKFPPGFWIANSSSLQFFLQFFGCLNVPPTHDVLGPTVNKRSMLKTSSFPTLGSSLLEELVDPLLSSTNPPSVLYKQRQPGASL